MSDETVVSNLTWKEMKEFGVMDDNLEGQLFYKTLTNEEKLLVQKLVKAQKA